MAFANINKEKQSHRQPRHIESKIQQGMVQWFRAQYPRYICAAVPNGGYRTPREAAIMRSEGVLAGFSDLIIIAQGNALFVEVKTAQGKQSPKQKVFQDAVERLGFQYSVCRSVDDFRMVVARWLRDKLGKW